MKEQNKIRFKKSLFAISVFLLSAATTALAAPTAITMMPVKFILDLFPGQINDQRLILSNPNNFEIALRPEVEDFEPAPDSAGVNFVPKAPGITSLVDWIEISKELVVLKPNEQREIFFKIKVPENPEPGSHFAAVFFKTQPLPGQGGSSLAISTRIGSLILVTIPGNVVRAGKILSFKGPKFINKGPVEFSTTFKNTGSVHYEVLGTIGIKNIFKKQIAEISTDKQWILPTGQKTLKAVWDIGYIFGPHEALLEIKDGADDIQRASFKFFALPWKETLLALISFIVFIIATRLIGKRFRITISKR